MKFMAAHLAFGLEATYQRFLVSWERSCPGRRPPPRELWLDYGILHGTLIDLYPDRMACFARKDLEAPIR